MKIWAHANGFHDLASIFYQNPHIRYIYIYNVYIYIYICQIYIYVYIEYIYIINRDIYIYIINKYIYILHIFYLYLTYYICL